MVMVKHAVDTWHSFLTSMISVAQVVRRDAILAVHRTGHSVRLPFFILLLAGMLPRVEWLYRWVDYSASHDIMMGGWHGERKGG